MRIVEYDDENYAILVRKSHLKSAGIRLNDDVYVVTLENGMLAVIRKASFKEHLRSTIRSSIFENGEGKPALSLSNDEESLIAKLVSLKFDERSPEKVLGMLDDMEKALLRRLIDKGMISVYKSGRYRDSGIYRISEDAYSIVSPRHSGSESASPNLEKRPAAPQHSVRIGYNNSTGGSSPADLKGLAEAHAKRIEEFSKKGFLMLESEEHAKGISLLLKRQIKEGSVLGSAGLTQNTMCLRSPSTLKRA